MEGIIYSVVVIALEVDISLKWRKTRVFTRNTSILDIDIKEMKMDWLNVLKLSGANLIEAGEWASVFDGFERNTDVVRKVSFVVQVLHESAMLTAVEENLNYSAKGLMATFSAYRGDEELAMLHARKPEVIGNTVYSNRLGNGDFDSGDGFRYRGRGLIQLTGRNNYRQIGRLIGIDLERSPEYMEAKGVSFRAAVAYWKWRRLDVPNTFAEQTKRLNGGLTGITHRREVYLWTKDAMKMDDGLEDI